MKDLKGTITGLEKDLEDCAYARNRLDGEVAMLKGRSREMEGQIENLGAQLKTSEENLSTAKKEQENLSLALEEAKAVPPVVIPNTVTEDDSEVSSNDAEPDAMDEIANADKAASGLLDDNDGDTSSGIIDDITSAAAPIAAGAALGGSDEEGDLSEDQLAAGKSVFGFKIKQDDLKIIEGVGPKIEGLLKDANLKTWWAVGNSEVDTIKKILEDAGPRYRLADPTTWPQQASYAAKGEWQKLKEYQDRLDGGRLG